MSKILSYLKEVEQTHLSNIAREHAYRGFLQNLLHQILPEEIRATNEPARISCGSPDYVLTKKNIPVGYIEAKDLGANLADKKHQEQLDRYRFSLPNFIFTNYLDFHFYRDGSFVTAISIAKITPENIAAIPANFEQFETLLKNFASHISQSIKSPKSLACMMAKKAKLLAIIIENALNSDEENQQNSSLKEQMDAFREILIHNIKPKEFADIYAQTIAYGMFAARLHDQSLNTFSRQEAADLIPKTNPFLRRLFQYVAGYDLDNRISWIVDDLAEIFRATDITALLENFGKATKKQDPIIHFYETFLSEYDPTLRKSRGVWYTPQPVVNFIVRATDEILKSEFGLKDGLADTTKIKKKISSGLVDKRTKDGYSADEKEFHKVQILDPATGTGTFLTEAIKQIHQKFAGQQGVWSRYVDEHLIPRLNGFELLMASYAMAHLKLDLLLTETGYKSGQIATQRDNRFKIFLTNSLEEANPDQNVPLLAFMRELTIEGLEAAKVKNETPVMVILGNPPYSGESQNKSDWIMKLMEDYKKEPNSNEKLKEKNPKWINDDYVKFLRFGQYFIEKNGEGILAFINPHGFLDNPTFRSVRFSLLQTYDKIYAIDLHGNTKKKEVALDGSKDENVFDIQQGVSINIFVKNGKKKAGELAQVFHFDCFGKREDKYNFLWENSLSSIAFKTLENIAPMYFMVPKDFELKKEYEEGFSVAELFVVNGVGITTAHDEFVIHEKEEDLLKFYQDFQASERNENLLHQKFNVKKKLGWSILNGYDNIKNETDLKKFIKPISYRPFDNRYIFYETKLVWRTVEKVMQNFLAGENLGLITARSNKSDTCDHFYITKNISETKCGERTTQSAVFPLYLYNQQPESADLLNHSKPARVPNLNPKIIKEISIKLGLEFVPDHEFGTNTDEPLTPTLSRKGRESFSEFDVTSSSNSSKGRESFSELDITPSPLAGEGWGEGFDSNHPYQSPNHRTYASYFKTFSRSLRKNQSDAEAKLWNLVRNNQLGFKFRRQFAINNKYIADFVCLEKRLIIELDGGQHCENDKDFERTLYLKDQNFRVMRFWNNEILQNPESCLETIILELDFLESKKQFSPLDILDYIYAVLHSPKYREKYQEFLKIDFPRVPYPQDQNSFWQLVKLGGELRKIHLLEGEIFEKLITKYLADGDNKVEKISYESNKVKINQSQYFEGVAPNIWEFFIGGYQPAQKWLKDRKGKILGFEEILHYQKIIVALSETDRLMKEIVKIN
jgi:predicted helicase